MRGLQNAAARGRGAAGAWTARCALACAALALAVVALLALAPASAYAKDYSCPEVNIAAMADADGTFYVQEHRTFDFDGEFTCVWWELGKNLPADASIAVAGISLASGSGGDDAAFEELPEVEFESLWRDEGGPGYPAWSYDAVYDTVYAFFEADDEALTFQLDYAVVNGVQVYEDVAELYWAFVGSNWAVDSENVTALVQLPMPAGETAQPGENVRAWGHGALNGEVTVNGDGTVLFEIPRVDAGTYAEARITFPAEWMTGVSPDAVYNYSALDSIVNEEQEWADEANRQRTLSRILLFGVGGVCLASIIVTVILYFLYGREYKPEFIDEYWRDVPEPGMQPAVVSALMKWGSSDSKELIATIMSLSQKGALRIDAVAHPDERGRSIEDYQITLLPAAHNVTDPIEKATLDFLFKDVPGRADVRWMDEITHFGEKSPRSYIAAMDRWKKTLAREVKREQFFEQRGNVLMGAISTWGVLLGVAGIMLTMFTENFWPVIFTFITAFILVPLSTTLRRRTRRANEIMARCNALKKWLQDFSRIDERPPTDVKVWGQLMVYAYLMGVAKQAIKQLQKVMPQVFDDSQYDTSMGMPWWYWYSRPYGFHSTVSFADALDRAVANTLSSAIAATSPSSSGSGGGGGFSMGGGGGFGGGGGAR